ncbi:PIR Superfamily Protein [Plasmodium ovale wallikeri]|uniref:PIR Superfamily Protein n=1 Tax=Plasmodium ovale wallikeri TaxID=864142 RepID=A0A1A9A890_PLAOA|nr:PIR Superfamily Protein [Plasmodium ovale wallikeri]
MTDIGSKYPHLPAYKYFQEFNSDENVRENCEKCVITSYLANTYPWIKKLCCKLHKNIKIVNKPENVTSYLGEKHCFDLNYWLYNEVYKHLEHDEKHQDYNYIVDYLMEIWKRIKKEDYADWKYLCNPDKTLCDMNFLKEVKTLFDNAENYFVIRDEALSSLANTCSKYFDYISYNAELYYKWKKICTNGENNICTKYIDNFYSYNPERVIRKYSKWSLFWLYTTNRCIQKIVSVVKGAQESSPVVVLKSRPHVEISTYEQGILNDLRKESKHEEEEDDELLHEEEGEIIYDSDTEDILGEDEDENEGVELKTTKNIIGENSELIKDVPPVDTMEEDTSGNNFLLTLEKSIPFAYNSIPEDSIPLHSIPFHSPALALIPFHSIPFHSIPFHSVPFHSIPFHSIPFRSIPFHSILFGLIPFHSIRLQSC